MFRRESESNLDDFKKKRQQFSINIRRNNRQQILNKRRNIDEGNQYQNTHNNMSQNQQQKSKEQTNIVDFQYGNQIRMLHHENYQLQNYQFYVSMLDSDDYLTKIKGLVGIRMTTDSQKRQTVNLFISKGLINKLISFLKQSQYPQIKLQSIWIIANLSFSSEGFCGKIIQNGIAQPLVKLIIENQEFIIDNSLVTIGNVAADNTKYRDILLKAGGLQAIYQCLANFKKQITYENCIWAISNLTRGSPPPQYNLANSVISVLCKALKSDMLGNINKINALWTLSGLSEHSKPNVDRIDQEDIMPLLIKYAVHENGNLYFPSIRILGNFSQVGESQTQVLIKNGIFDVLMKILNHPKKTIRRQACWILSNIAAGVKSQVLQFIGRKDILDKIASMFESQQTDTKVQICWIYPNLGHFGPKKQIVALYLHYDVMRFYTSLLSCKNAQLLQNVLKALNKLLLIGNSSLLQGKNIMLHKFMEYQGVQKVQDLQQHESTRVYKAAIAILTKFFDVDDN